MNVWDRILQLISEKKVDETLIVHLLQVAYSRGVIDGLDGTAGPDDTKDVILPRVIQIINAGAGNVSKAGGVR